MMTTCINVNEIIKVHVHIGQESHYNIKICTWNANGLTINKLIDNIEHFNDFDIILLSETWLKPNHLYDMNIQGYTSVCLSRACTNRNTKRESGGLMCYIRNEIKEGIEYVNSSCNNLSEDRLWINLSANYFGFDKDLYLCLIYITPETSTHQSSRNSLWNILKEEIANFSTTGPILLTGDFNARTGSLLDYVNHDSDLHIPLPPDYMVDTPIPRKSEDCVVNNYGRELLDLYALLVDYR